MSGANPQVAGKLMKRQLFNDAGCAELDPKLDIILVEVEYKRGKHPRAVRATGRLRAYLCNVRTHSN